MEYVENQSSIAAYSPTKKYLRELFIDKPIYVGKRTIDMIKSPAGEAFGGSGLMFGPSTGTNIFRLLTNPEVNYLYSSNPLLDAAIFSAHVIGGGILMFHGITRASHKTKDNQKSQID